MAPRALKCACILALTALALFVRANGQQSTGAVSGHVVCADTQRPARFAQVTLIGVPSATTPAKPDPNATTAQQMSAVRTSMSSLKMIAFQQTDTLRSYQEAKETIVVTDSALPGQDFGLAPAAKTAQKPDFNQMFGGASSN